jgi:hypothetical protein
MPCLARRCLREFYPTAGDVLSADLKGLGEALLIHLDSYEGRSTRQAPAFCHQQLKLLLSGMSGSYNRREPRRSRSVAEPHGRT